MDVGDGTIKFSARWLLHQLITHFQPYMRYKSVVNKLGTLLYPSNCDVLKSLSLALHAETSDHDDQSFSVFTRQANPKSVLRQAGDVINDTVHNGCKSTPMI